MVFSAFRHRLCLLWQACSRLPGWPELSQTRPWRHASLERLSFTGNRHSYTAVCTYVHHKAFTWPMHKYIWMVQTTCGVHHEAITRIRTLSYRNSIPLLSVYIIAPSATSLYNSPQCYLLIHARMMYFAQWLHLVSWLATYWWIDWFADWYIKGTI